MSRPPPPAHGQSFFDQQKDKLERAQEAAVARDWVVAVLAAAAAAAVLTVAHGRPCIDSTCVGGECACLEWGAWSPLRITAFILGSLVIVAPLFRRWLNIRRSKRFWQG